MDQETVLSRIPLAWQEVLGTVRAKFPGAVCAGGCLRDLWNQVPVKDVDIFIPLVEFYPEDIDALMDCFPDAPRGLFTPDHNGWKTIACSIYGRGNAELERDIFGVYHKKINGIEFDFIFIRGSVVDISTFDINICQVAYNGNEVHGTKDFHDGMNNKHLKVMNINRTDRNMKRLQKMKDKYPDWSADE